LTASMHACRIKTLARLLVLALLPAALCLCAKPLPFDRGIAGSYELLNGEGAPEYLHVYGNGSFIDSAGSGWIQIDGKNSLSLLYDGGGSPDARYEKSGPLLKLQSGNAVTSYVDSNSFADESGIAPGNYIDEDLTLVFTFLDTGQGLVRRLGSTDTLAFAYKASGGILRLGHPGPGPATYEYAAYESSAGSLMLSFDDGGSITLFGESETPADGQYALIHDGDPDDGCCISEINFTDGSVYLDDIVCNYLSFSNNAVVVRIDSVLYPLEMGLFGARLLLKIGGRTLEFINTCAFEDDSDAYAGIYASSDLGTVLCLNADGTGSYTRGGVGIDFTYTITIYENILRCRDVNSGRVIYLEFAETAVGLDIAELPAVGINIPDYGHLIKIG